MPEAILDCWEQAGEKWRITGRAGLGGIWVAVERLSVPAIDLSKDPQGETHWLGVDWQGLPAIGLSCEGVRAEVRIRYDTRSASQLERRILRTVAKLRRPADRYAQKRAAADRGRDALLAVTHRLLDEHIAGWVSG